MAREWGNRSQCFESCRTLAAANGTCGFLVNWAGPARRLGAPSVWLAAPTGWLAASLAWLARLLAPMARPLRGPENAGQNRQETVGEQEKKRTTT